MQAIPRPTSSHHNGHHGQCFTVGGHYYTLLGGQTPMRFRVQATWFCASVVDSEAEGSRVLREVPVFDARWSIVKDLVGQHVV